MLTEWLTALRFRTHEFLLPFLQYPESHLEEPDWGRESELFKITYSRCRYHHTRLLVPEEGVLLGPEESTLRWAVEETMGSICSVIVDVGLSVESLFDIPSTQSKFSIPPHKMKTDVKRWTEGVEELMAWLGWAGEWTGCKERCAWDEKCFIPMWPLLARRGWGGPYGYLVPYPYMPSVPASGFPGWTTDESDLWQPVCVKANYLYD